MSMQAKAVVVVNYLDGEQVDYPISANIGISRDLAEQAGKNGCLSLWNAEESYGIPVRNVRDWTVRELTPDEQKDYNDGKPVRQPRRAA